MCSPMRQGSLYRQFPLYPARNLRYTHDQTPTELINPLKVCVCRACTDDAFARAFVCSSMGHTGRHANASSNRMNPLLLLYKILVTAIFALLNFPLSPSLPPIVLFVSPSTPLLLAHTSERQTSFLFLKEQIKVIIIISVRTSLLVLTILAFLIPHLFMYI